MWINQITEPTLIIFKEKYGDRYFLVNDQEQWYKVALQMLRERHDAGHWYPTAEQVEKDYEWTKARIAQENTSAYLDLSDEEVDALPEALKGEAIKVRKVHKTALHNAQMNYKRQTEFIRLLDKVLEAEEGWKKRVRVGENRTINLALWLLNFRAPSQYEGYDMQPVETID